MSDDFIRDAESRRCPSMYEGEFVLRVASVPSSHVYVQHLSDPAGTNRVVRLPDPVPADGCKVPGGWWRPLMLDPGWIARHHSEFDIFHVHFGFDAVAPEAMAAVLRELRRHDKPLVYTAHDLRNPHHPDPSAHREHLDALIPAAHRVITLTLGAAEQIRTQWGRMVSVLPHPHVVERPLIEQQRPRRERCVIGVHVKSLRANMDPFPVLDALADIVAELPSAELLINVHDELFRRANHWYAPRAGAALIDYAKRPSVRVWVHPYFSEAQLWAYLSQLTASVLPYRFGTHSGWLEACYDLGTAVIAPSCGFFGQQRPCETYEFTEKTFDTQSLRDSVYTVYDRHKSGMTAPRAAWPQRRQERAVLAAAHHDIYRGLAA